MQNRLWRALGMALLQVFGAHALAQDSISVPADSKFVMQINLQAFKNSKVGVILFEIAKKAAMEEVGKNLDSKGFSGDKIQEVLGLDPFESKATTALVDLKGVEPNELVRCVLAGCTDRDRSNPLRVEPLSS